MEARKARAEVARLARELEAAKSRVTRLESLCHHKWSDPVYAPVVRKGYQGIDPMSHPGRERETWVPRQETPMWARTCAVCDKVETTTQTTEQITKSPRF